MAERIYLQATYAERERVKSLGARYDGVRKSWFVPPGLSLAPFEPWLPADVRATIDATAVDVVRGVSLSQLLGRVSHAVTTAFGSNEWVRVEVIKVQVRSHVYLELAERDTAGNVRAQARGVIWSATAERILPKFERDTGVVLGPNLKLLVSAKPNVHSQYGLSLQIDDLDPQYTLGDLEARRREIRSRLMREGLYERNRLLPAPWDFRTVLVLAPELAAGLGDFMAEARRLERWAVCSFEVVHARFQGEGAANEMRQALLEALATWQSRHGTVPDAVVIIRGGGAVSDLAWLDDYALARCVCELDVPVFTGIGHERDSTILDEVAHTRFDTPSKVIVGIERGIVQRVREARQAAQAIHAEASRAIAAWRAATRQADASVREGALRHIDRARTSARDRHDEIRASARRSLVLACEAADERIGTIRKQAMLQLDEARRLVPRWIAEVSAEARQALRSARQRSVAALTTVMDRTQSDLDRERDRTHEMVRAVAQGSMRAIGDARDRSHALLREIVGQGPDKTLKRGFAVVHDAQGQTVTSAAALREVVQISVQFSDGSVPAVVREDVKPN